MSSTAEAYGLSFSVPPGDTVVGPCLREHGEFVRPELELLLAYSEGEPGHLFDVGANLGTIGVPFAAQRPSWWVHCFEPSPVLSDLLHDTLQRNGVTNVSLVRAAVGAHAGSVAFPLVKPTATGNFGDLNLHWPKEMPHIDVPMTTLDDHATESVRIVKVDVQGHEAHVLRGASRLLGEIRPIWLIEAADPKVTAAVLETLFGEGYRLFWFYSPFVTPAAPRGRVRDPGRGDVSVLALPEGTSNIWSLPPVSGPQDVRPGHASAYPYLKRYGY